jgi:sortase A
MQIGSLPVEGRLQHWWLRVRNRLPVVLILAGLVLLLFVGTQYARAYLEQRRLVLAWEKQQLQRRSEPGDSLTRLSIPKISLSAIVIEGTSRHDLLLGPGHISNTAMPGETGYAVITGHRDTFFRHIYELDKGDLVSVQRDGSLYRYEVTGKKIVSPEDLSVLRQSSDNRLTLITCYPIYYIGPAPRRLVVFSKMVDETTHSAAK